MSIGRNDPCPCGSGTKYKRCHGASTSSADPKVARANALKDLDVDLAARLLRFVKLRFGNDWMADALEEYAGTDERELPDSELTLAIPWVLYFRRDAAGRTVADAWAADRASRLTDLERTLLDAYANAWLSMWEVARVDRGIGVALVDQLTREERFAYDVGASSTLTTHDVMLAVVLDCDGVAFFGGIHAQPLPPHYADGAVRAARKMCRVRTRAVSPDALRDNDTQLELVDLWNDVVDDMFDAPPPTLTNTDGDLFAVTTDDFEMKAPLREVVDRLASIDGAQPAGEEDGRSVVVFTKAGNAANRDWDNTVIGRAVVDQRSLRVETNSARRADALRARIEEHLGGMVRYRLRQEMNTADLMARASAGGPAAQRSTTPAPQSPEISAMMRQFRENHMRSWIDESIPALGGLTPREAARLPKSRAALELLLKDIERSESLLPEDEQIDISWLRPELGLDRR